MKPPQGELPSVSALWDNLGRGQYRPKDEQELSDTIARHLRRDLQDRGVVASREVGIRIDGGIVNYGDERQQVLLSPTVGGRISVGLTTSNNIFFIGVGPHLMLPNGRLRPYLFGTGGVAYFVTESSL